MNLSLITATFNSMSLLPSALQSVQFQSIRSEHIVVDGGSNDGTSDFLKSMKSPGLRWNSEADNGLYDALNKGIRQVETGVVGVLHADDLLADEHVLRDVVNGFSDNSIDAVYGDVVYVQRNDPSRVVRYWRSGEYQAQSLYRGWMPPHPTFFVRRECYEKYGLYRLDLGTAADYELMLRFLLVHNIRVKYIPRVLVKMRVGGASNASIKARVNANRMDRKAWQVNGLKPYPWTLLAKPLRKVGQWWVR